MSKPALTWTIVAVVVIAAVLLITLLPADDEPTTTNGGGTITETVTLREQNNSDQSGQVRFVESNGRTQVTIDIDLPTASSTATSTAVVSQPAHIHDGACPNPGAVRYPLNDVVSGMSVTTINATIAQLKAQQPLAVNVHKSVAQSSIYVACGDLDF